jgi:hypothetical protein
VIIANLLHGRGIGYRYEEPLEIDGLVKYPDFTIEDDDAGVTYYWEHCGMLGDPGYRRRWKEKQEWYHTHNIWPPGEGSGASKGTLIITRDEPDGGIDSHGINKLIKTLFG